MAGIGLAAELLDTRFVERDAGEHGHSVIALLPVDRVVGVPQLMERPGGEEAVLDLGFLQAQDVRLVLPEEAGHLVDPQADGVDVPSGDLHFRCMPLMLDSRIVCHDFI